MRLKEIDTDKLDKEYIAKLLSILGKQRCADTKSKMRDAFGLSDEDGDMLPFSDMVFCQSKARQELIKHHVKKKASGDNGFDRYSKKINNFSKSLKKSLELMGTQEVKTFLGDAAERGAFATDYKMAVYENTFQQMNRLAFEVETLRFSMSKRGRPSIKALEGYVFQLAKLYEGLSGADFTLDKKAAEIGDVAKKNLVKSYTKQDDAQREYPTLTNGHQFVACGVEWINREVTLQGGQFQYTNTNIYNACESVRSALTKEKSSLR